MSHAESGVGGMTNGGSGSSVSAHKKLRRKRKELDALVGEDKLRRKSSSASRHDLFHSDSDDVEFAGRSNDKAMFGGLLGCLPGACGLIVFLVTAVGVASTLRLLMATRRDLDALQMRLNAGKCFKFSPLLPDQYTLISLKTRLGCRILGIIRSNFILKRRVLYAWPRSS